MRRAIPLLLFFALLLAAPVAAADGTETTVYEPARAAWYNATAPLPPSPARDTADAIVEQLRYAFRHVDSVVAGNVAEQLIDEAEAQCSTFTGGPPGLACSTVSGDPSFGAFRPCSSEHGPQNSIPAYALQVLVQGGTLRVGPLPGAEFPGADPVVSGATSEHLAGTPLEGESPCADHWETARRVARLLP